MLNAIITTALIFPSFSRKFTIIGLKHLKISCHDFSLSFFSLHPSERTQHSTEEAQTLLEYTKGA